jgi:hypothetical protein
VYVAGSNNSYLALAFVGTGGGGDESCFLMGNLPESYAGGNIQFTFYWIAASGSTSGHNVSWDASILGRIDDEPFDAAYTETHTVNDLVTTVGDLNVVTSTAAAATLAAGDFVSVKVLRDYDEANGGTGLAQDAYLLALRLDEE